MPLHTSFFLQKCISLLFLISTEKKKLRLKNFFQIPDSHSNDSLSIENIIYKNYDIYFHSPELTKQFDVP